MRLLVTEYIPEHKLYVAIPLYGKTLDPLKEFVFCCEELQQEFVQAYHQNPVAAEYAYWQMMQNTVNQEAYDDENYTSPEETLGLFISEVL